MSSQLKRRGNDIAIFLIALVCYAYFLPRWADQNQNSRLNAVVAVVDDGTFRIDKYVHNTTDYAKVGDHYYSDKAPGVAFLGIPIYAGLSRALKLPVLDQLSDKLANSDAFRATLRTDGSGVQKDKVRFALALVLLSFLLGAIPSAILCVVLYRLSTQLVGNATVGALVALTYGFLTPAFAYANTLYGHQLVATLTFGAFYLAAQRERPAVGRLVIIGILLGYSVITEYPTVLIVSIVGLYVAYRLWRAGDIKRVIWLLPGLAVCALALMIYNTALFGGPFKLGYGNSELWEKQHSTGFLSLTFPHLDALWGITFGLFRGLFVLSPIMLLAVAGFVWWWRSRAYRAEWWTALMCTLSFLLFNASSVMWWGGFAVGPRYLLPALPFAALALGFAFNPIVAPSGSRAWRVVCAFLALGSFVATWGLTLAEQAFPSDTIFDPLVEYALPNWLVGNIARNAGTLLGFKGIAGLVPLVGVTALIGLVWRVAARRQVPHTATIAPPITATPSTSIPRTTGPLQASAPDSRLRGGSSK